MIMSQSPLRSTASASFEAVLHASGPDRDREAKLALYAWLVGSWDIENHNLHGRRDNTRRAGRDSCRMGAPRTRNTRCLDDTPPERAKAGRKAAARERQLVWHDASHLRPKSGRLARLVERPCDRLFHAADWASAGSDIVQEGQDPRGGARATARQPPLLTCRLIGFGNSRSEQILD